MLNEVALRLVIQSMYNLLSKHLNKLFVVHLNDASQSPTKQKMMKTRLAFFKGCECYCMLEKWKSRLF